MHMLGLSLAKHHHILILNIVFIYFQDYFLSAYNIGILSITDSFLLDWQDINILPDTLLDMHFSAMQQEDPYLTPSSFK